MLNGHTNWNNAFDIMQPELHLVDVNEVFEAFKHCKNADRRMFVAYVQKRLNEIRFKEEQPFFESFRDLLQNYQTLYRDDSNLRCSMRPGAEYFHNYSNRE